MDLTAFVRALSPNRPLAADDPRYVERPENGGEHLARIARIDPDPIAVFGPAGVGKSTELLRAAHRLGESVAPVLVQLDRVIDLSDLTLERVFDACSDAIESAVRRLSSAVAVAAMGVIAGPVGKRPAYDRLLDAIRARTRDGQRTIFLVDGLEKADERSARVVLDGLLRLAPEAGLVVVVPPSLLIGPASYRAMEDYRPFSVNPLPHVIARDFLGSVLDHRVDGAVPNPMLIDEAAWMSGGITRTFLSLLKSAALYAALADRDAIGAADWDSAVTEHAEAMARILAGGDIDLLARLVNGAGIDVLPTEARARLISHGVLLGADVAAGLAAIHPLLQRRVEAIARASLLRDARGS